MVKRILVSGITGFVGRSILRYLGQNPGTGGTTLEVLGISRDTDAHIDLENRYPFLTCSKADVTRSLPNLGPVDLFIHCATPASASMIRNNPGEMLDNIISGSRNVIDYCRQQGNCPTVLFTSSGAVYNWGLTDSSRKSEQDNSAPTPLLTTSCYGEGKRLAELMFTLANEEGSLQFKNARMFTFIGLDLPLTRHFAIGNFIRDAVVGQEIIVNGNPETVRSYLWAGDLAHWMMMIAEKGQSCYPYHVGSENEITIGDLALLVARIAQHELGRPVSVRLPMATSAPRSYYVPETRITRNELALSETISLENSIRETIIHHVNNL